MENELRNMLAWQTAALSTIMRHLETRDGLPELELDRLADIEYRMMETK